MALVFSLGPGTTQAISGAHLSRRGQTDETTGAISPGQAQHQCRPQSNVSTPFLCFHSYRRNDKVQGVKMPLKI